MKNKWLIFLAFVLMPQWALALLPIQHWTTAQGAKVYLVQNPDIPMLDLSIDFAAGSVRDRREKSGVAYLTNHLIQMGAEGLDEEAIANAMADIGAGMSGRFDQDRAGLSLRTLSQPVERAQAIDILIRSLKTPLFPAAVVEREKTRLISSLKDAQIQPGRIASIHFNQLVFGAHPYALRASGETQTLETVTREDLVSFYRQHYVARGAIIAMVGDISIEEAKDLAERLTQGLVVRSEEPLALPAVVQTPPGQTKLIDHDSAQTHILLGGVGVSRTDPDYFALLVGNHILGGGGFTSRITEQVRQQRGLAYSAYSYFMPMADQGVFMMGMQTRPEQAEEALRVSIKTLKEFVRQGPTTEELINAQKNLVGSFPLRIDSNRKIHEYLSVIGFYQLPLNYLELFVGKVENVSAKQIQEAFSRHIDTEQLMMVVVGVQAQSVKP